MLKIKKGLVYWITGLSGAGKTTIGKLVYESLLIKKNNIVFLDGDMLREVFANDLGYTQKDRHKCAMRYSRLCKLLSEQGLDVVCCTISMFHDVRLWNKTNLENYYEVYIKVPIDILRKRDQKGLYSKIENGSTEDVVGMDLKLEFPVEADLILENTGEFTPKVLADKILNSSADKFGE